jgi:V/A-type H+-transporting ATPase subunit D
MPDLTPTRAAVLELQDERRAMREGHAFLDEKCLLLAAEMLAQLRLHAQHREAFDAAFRGARNALRAAIARHGLEGLQVYPVPDEVPGTLAREPRSLLGVALQSVRWDTVPAAAAPTVARSPEAEDCRCAFAALFVCAAHLAALSGNLLRLSREYDRSVRRARALHDVLLPELEASVRDMEARLEEIEQEDALRVRWRESA